MKCIKEKNEPSLKALFDFGKYISTENSQELMK